MSIVNNSSYSSHIHNSSIPSNSSSTEEFSQYFEALLHQKPFNWADTEFLKKSGIITSISQSLFEKIESRDWKKIF